MARSYRRNHTDSVNFGSVNRSPGAPVDFVELFNPGNFSACAQDLSPGLIIDMSVDPDKAMRVETYRMQARHDIGAQDPMIVTSAPPCRVFSAMQNINQKHHATPKWEKKCHEARMLMQFSVDIYWDQVSRGKFFLHEHPATASSWDLPIIRELAEHPGVSVVTGDMRIMGCGLQSEELALFTWHMEENLVPKS